MNPFEERKQFLGRLKALKRQQNAAPQPRKELPENVFVQCSVCGKSSTQLALSQHLRVCPYCDHHHALPAYYRLKTILDSGTFRERFAGSVSANPLDFAGYEDKKDKLRDKTGLDEAVVTATGQIGGSKCVVCVMDSRFLMGSMGSVVGEKITLAVEYATQQKLPVIIFCASGGARMQEGIVSLFQMAKTSAAMEAHARAGQLYISVLTHPTTGGVTASFASLGDIILAEPQALIGFAGPRVIEQTIRQQLPEGFQRAEYLLEHGFVDAIVPRHKMRDTLAQLLSLHAPAAAKAVGVRTIGGKAANMQKTTRREA